MQYILAVEVVLNPDEDQAVVRAAFTSADISASLVDGLLRELEETAIRIAWVSEHSFQYMVDCINDRNTRYGSVIFTNGVTC